MPYNIIRTERFKSDLQRLRQQEVTRLDDWLAGFEFVLPTKPQEGEMVGCKRGYKLYMVKCFDLTNNRYVRFLYTIQEDKVIFLRAEMV